MRKFSALTGIVIPLDRANVDTDFIIPKQFLKSIKRTGFGVNLFDEHRYLDKGFPDADNSNRPLNPDFVLNMPRYSGASILLARENFGCGSSREHAPWALEDYGIQVLIAPSYADIFFNNCFKNGLLPIVIESKIVDDLFSAVEAQEGFELTIDLPEQTITTPQGEIIDFEIDEYKKYCLLNGLDEIGVSLQDADSIRNFERQWREKAPWYFTGESS
jgi:3-isopropylmalate/(R)-2-methylmalate dehydratase small subunit